MFLFLLASSALAAEPDLLLSELQLNGQSIDNTEVIFQNGNLYLPLRTLAELLDIELSYDRAQKTAQYKSYIGSKQIKVDGLNSSIDQGEERLDPQANPVFVIAEGFVLREELLVSARLIAESMNCEITFDDDTYTLNVSINRRVKALAGQGFSAETEELAPVRPTLERFNIHSLQASLGAFSNASPQAQKSFSFGNQLLLNATGDLLGGIYSVGPSLFLTDESIGFGSVRQSWIKELKPDLVLALGDSITQFDILSLPSASFLGVKIGSPEELNWRNSSRFSLQGACTENSEILLEYNGNLLARQICKTGRYSIGDIPRLVGTSNAYRLLQRNTDGTELVLRDQIIPYYADLIGEGERRWQAFAGHPSFNNTITLGKNTSGSGFSDQTPSKLAAGANLTYGLSPRVNLESSVAGDFLYSVPGNVNALTQGGPAFFQDARVVQGQTVGFGLNARPKDDFGFRLNGAFSFAQDRSPSSSNNRAGFGQALYLDTDFRRGDFFGQATAFYYSPGFYSPASVISNRYGLTANFGLPVGNHSFSGNFRHEVQNADGKSQGGPQKTTSALITHNWRGGDKLSVSNTLSANEASNDTNAQYNLNLRSVTRRKINDRLDVTMSAGIFRQVNLKPENSTLNLLDLTPGLTVYFDREQRNQLSGGLSLFSDNSRNAFLQGRFAWKNLVYQPSVSYFSTADRRNAGITISQGLFWEQQTGLRLGLEYIFSNLSSGDGSTTFIGGDINRQNHVVRLTLLSNLAFAQGKPYLASSSSAGYSVGRVFVDLGGDGKFDGADLPLTGASVTIAGNKLISGKDGSFQVKDLPAGVYEASLDALSLPITVVPREQNISFLVQTGRRTDLSFTSGLNAGSVSGRLYLTDLEGHSLNPNNIVLVALEAKSGKQVSYTYTDSRGFYTISELPPGSYVLSVDKFDIKNRNLTVTPLSLEFQIDLNLEEPIELEGFDFRLRQSLF